MKKNLLAMLLAVIMVAAVIFIAAPATKAETEAKIQKLDANAELTISEDTILDLYGFDATVSVNEGVTLTIVDTKFMADDDNWDLTGASAGTLTVAEGSTSNIKAWEQFGDYKYLAVKSEAGTYSAHPFNIMLSTVGVNTYSTKITVGITVIADNVVANLIDAGEFGLHNHTLDGQTNHAEYNNRYAKHTAEFNGKNGLRVHFDLTNSLTEDVLTENRSNEFGAYIKVDAGYGALTVDSLSTTEIAPKTVLEEVNAKANTFAAQQKAKMAAMLDKEDAAYLKDYCDRFKSTWVLVTDVADLNAGDIIVIAAKDYNFALSTTQNWLANADMTQDKNQLNRGQTSAYADGSYIFFGADVQPLTLGTATVNDTSYFTFYTGNGYLRSGSSASRTRLQTYPSPATESAGYWSISFDDQGVATILAPFVADRGHLLYHTSGVFTSHNKEGSYTDVVIYKLTCEHTWDNGVVTNPTCATAGYTTYTCLYCPVPKVEAGEPATGDHNHVPGEPKQPTCGAVGYTTYTCVVCGDSYNSDEVAATGNHNYVSAVTEPGCTTPGFTTHTCSVCNDSYIDAQVPAAHKYVDGTCTVCGTAEGATVEPMPETTYSEWVNEKALTSNVEATYELQDGTKYTIYGNGSRTLTARLIIKPQTYVYFAFTGTVNEITLTANTSYTLTTGREIIVSVSDNGVDWTRVATVTTTATTTVDLGNSYQYVKIFNNHSSSQMNLPAIIVNPS